MAIHVTAADIPILRVWLLGYTHTSNYVHVATLKFFHPGSRAHTSTVKSAPPGHDIFGLHISLGSHRFPRSWSVPLRSKGRDVEDLLMSYNCPTLSVSCPSYSTSQSGQSPCCTAQMVDQSCGQNYTISTSNFTESLYIPNATTANYATCSWAAYNLLSACANCLEQSTWASWATYSANCGNYVSSTTYFPWDQGCRLPDSETFPYFAATNPNYWSNGIFNVNEATANGSSVASDVTGSPLPTPSSSAASSSSKSSLGAIVGGVVGALAVIGLAGFILWYFVRRRRRQAQGRSGVPSAMPPSHNPMAQTPTSYEFTSSPSSHEFPNTTSRFISPTSVTNTSLRSPLITDAADMITPFYSPSTLPVPPSTKAAYTPTDPAGSSSTPSTPSPPPTKHRSAKRIRHLATGSVDTVATTSEADSAPPQMSPLAKLSLKARLQAAEMRSRECGNGNGNAGTVTTGAVNGVGSTRRDEQVNSRVSRNRPPVV